MSPVPACPGCGEVVPPVEGPTHAYIGATPGCWALFTRLLATVEGPNVSGQLLLDVYAVQHPGVPERRAIQSVCAHLVSLCAALERGWPADKAPDLLRRAVARQAEWRWRWLDPRLPIGTITVRDVVSADAASCTNVVRAWADDVWDAYRLHHGEVRSWVDQLVD